MERFSPLLLDVWREACRHIEIGQSVDRVAPILVRRLPLELLLVRRIDWSRGSVETVATGVCRGAPLHLRAKNECPREAMEHIRLWAETGEVICVAAEQARQRLPGLLPDGIDGEMFYQKDMPDWVPPWLRTTALWSEHSQREIHYVLIDDADGLAFISRVVDEGEGPQQDENREDGILRQRFFHDLHGLISSIQST